MSPYICTVWNSRHFRREKMQDVRIFTDTLGKEELEPASDQLLSRVRRPRGPAADITRLPVPGRQFPVPGRQFPVRACRGRLGGRPSGPGTGSATASALFCPVVLALINIDGEPGGRLALGPLSPGQCPTARCPAPSALKLGPS
ncbi:uncharacterized protein LOC144582953 [Callithrix jacchus]